MKKGAAMKAASQRIFERTLRETIKRIKSKEDCLKNFWDEEFID